MTGGAHPTSDYSNYYWYNQKQGFLRAKQQQEPMFQGQRPRFNHPNLLRIKCQRWFERGGDTKLLWQVCRKGASHNFFSRFPPWLSWWSKYIPSSHGLKILLCFNVRYVFRFQGRGDLCDKYSMGLQLWLGNEKFCHHSCWTLPSVCFVQFWFWQHLVLGRLDFSLHFSFFLLFLIIICFKSFNLSYNVRNHFLKNKCNRRKFRSQSSVNTDRWKAEYGQRQREEKD